MPAGQFVTAVRRDDHHRGVGQCPGKEPKQVAGGLVGPMNVLHDHYERPVLTRSLQKHGDCLEQLQPDSVIRLMRRCGEVGQQHPKRLAACASPVQNLLAAVLAHQVAQGAHNRRVRQTLVAHWYALTANQLRLAISQRTEEIGDERLDDRRLPDPCVATDNHETAAVINDVVQRATQPGTLPARPTMRSVRTLVADLAARTISTIVPPGSDA